MRRREFIAIVSGAAAAWPIVARAQQVELMRRIGVLIGLPEDHPEAIARLAGFQRGLEKRGWFEGRNVRVDYRFAPAGDQAQVLARELVALQPDVILANSTPVAAALQRESRAIPVVFAGIADPIGSGFIASLARPGGNMTGLMLFKASVTARSGDKPAGQDPRKANGLQRCRNSDALFVPKRQSFLDNVMARFRPSRLWNDPGWMLTLVSALWRWQACWLGMMRVDSNHEA